MGRLCSLRRLQGRLLPATPAPGGPWRPLAGGHLPPASARSSLGLFLSRLLLSKEETSVLVTLVTLVFTLPCLASP